MMHPFNSEALKQFNRVHFEFSMEPQNIYHILYTDGFNQFRSFIAPYFCCPIIQTVSNYLLRILISS
jgi:hypothetical protein